MPTSFDNRDLDACLAILRKGSKSFHAASLLLPARVRGSVAALYAFCRVSDDAVDGLVEGPGPLTSLTARLDAAYEGTPADDPVDRGLAHVVREHRIPRAIFDALLEGYAWDREGRVYEQIEDVEAYSARVAGTVGVMMTLVMAGDRRPETLARACDLGVAMQLTNIARDVGEDAREGRLYLPRQWMRESGVDPDTFLARPRFDAAIASLVRRLLARAEELYARADHGIPMLPADCRLAIRSAREIYADIGREIAAAGWDSVSRRAHTSRGRKAWLLARSLPWYLGTQRAPLPEPPLGAAAFLVEAAGR